MIDYEKVFNTFRNCITEPKCKNCEGLPECKYKDQKLEIPKALALDVLNALGERLLPVETVFRGGKFYCGACGKRIRKKIKARYCPKCGRKIEYVVVCVLGEKK